VKWQIRPCEGVLDYYEITGRRRAPSRPWGITTSSVAIKARSAQDSLDPSFALSLQERNLVALEQDLGVFQADGRREAATTPASAERAGTRNNADTRYAIIAETLKRAASIAS